MGSLYLKYDVYIIIYVCLKLNYMYLYIKGFDCNGSLYMWSICYCNNINIFV